MVALKQKYEANEGQRLQLSRRRAFHVTENSKCRGPEAGLPSEDIVSVQKSNVDHGSREAR